MRRKIIAGNWKMYTTTATARELAQGVVRELGSEERLETVVCPPFPYLSLVGSVLQGSRIALGAQNLHPDKEGAFTGEVSPTMLTDVGCKYVIVGHSERRHKLSESDDFVQRKVRSALDAGLQVIFCIGETLEERQVGQYELVLDRQVVEGLKGITSERLAAVWRQIVLAYEPVWAIGTGHNATPEQAQAAHAYLRQRLADIMGEERAQQLPILYGGSVKPENAASLLHQPDVDGVLVGGASLKADQFAAIARAAL